jgi:hypothetical protein
MYSAFPREVRRTADPSASLGMTKERVALPFKLDAAEDEQQVPPLRFATVGMTILFENSIPRFHERSAELQIPRLRSG